MIKVIVTNGFPEILDAANIKKELGLEPIVDLDEENIGLIVSKDSPNWTVRTITLSSVSGDDKFSFEFEYKDERDYSADPLNKKLVKITKTDLVDGCKQVFELQETQTSRFLER